MTGKPCLFPEPNRPLVLAHRGYMAHYPENTLVSFRAAVDSGCDGIEMDVTLSRDRRLAVIHDDTLDRTTGARGPVSAFTMAELKRLDAGSRFDRRFAGERIPELSEALDGIGNRCLVNIEIKGSAFEAAAPSDCIERQVAELVQRHARFRVVVSSFEPRVLERLATFAAPPPLAVLTNRPLDRQTLALLDRVQAVSWHPSARTLSPKQVRRAHEAGVRVFPWTVSTRGDWDRLIAMGVDGAFCNDPTLVGKPSPGAEEPTQ